MCYFCRLLCSKICHSSELCEVRTNFIGGFYERLSCWIKSHKFLGASLVAQTVKRLPAVWETHIQYLGWEDPLKKEMATHSSTLAWKMILEKRACFPCCLHPGKLIWRLIICLLFASFCDHEGKAKRIIESLTQCSNIIGHWNNSIRVPPGLLLMEDHRCHCHFNHN